MKHPLWKMVYEGFQAAILSYLKEKISKSTLCTIHPCTKHPLWGMVYEGSQAAILSYFKEKVIEPSVQPVLE